MIRFHHFSFFRICHIFFAMYGYHFESQCLSCGTSPFLASLFVISRRTLTTILGPSWHCTNSFDPQPSAKRRVSTSPLDPQGIRKGSRVSNVKALLSDTWHCCHPLVSQRWFCKQPSHSHNGTFANTGTECWSHGWSHWRIRTDRYPNLQRFFENGELTSLGLKKLLWVMELTSLMGPFSAGSTRALEEEEVWTVIRIHNGYTSATGRDLKLLKCEPDSDIP